MSYKLFQKYADWIESRKTPKWIRNAGDSLPSHLETFLRSFLVDSIRFMMEKGISLTDDYIKDDDIRKSLHGYRDSIIKDITHMSKNK